MCCKQFSLQIKPLSYKCLTSDEKGPSQNQIIFKSFKKNTGVRCDKNMAAQYLALSENVLRFLESVL